MFRTNQAGRWLVVVVLALSVVAGASNGVFAGPNQISPARKKQYQDAAIKLVAAAGAQGVSLHVKPDNDFGSIVAETLARVFRDRLVESAVKDLMPHAPKGVHRGVRRVACMYLDGELSTFSFTVATAKDEFIEALKAEDVQFGYLADGADFLLELHKAYRSK